MPLFHRLILIVAILVLGFVIVDSLLHQDIFSAGFTFFLAGGLSWRLFIERYDWNYLADRETYSMVGTVQVYSKTFLSNLDLGLQIHGNNVHLDLTSTKPKLLYWGRWLVYELTYHGYQIKLFQDRTKPNLWYFTV